MSSIDFKKTIHQAREAVISWEISGLPAEEQEIRYQAVHLEFYKAERFILDQYEAKQPTIAYAHQVHDVMATQHPRVASVWIQVVVLGQHSMITFEGNQNAPQVPKSQESLDPIFQKVRGIISEQLCIPEGRIFPGSTFEELGADSLDGVEIAMAIEEAYGIELPWARLPYEAIAQIRTVLEVVDLVRGKIN